MFITVTSKDTGGLMILNTQHIVGVIDDGESSVYIKMLGDDPAFKVVETLNHMLTILGMK